MSQCSRACKLQLLSPMHCNYWSPRAPALQQEKSPQWKAHEPQWRVAPAPLTRESPRAATKTQSSQKKYNKYINKSFFKKMIVHNTCWALFVTQAHFASYNLFCPHDNLFLITQMKISEAQTGVATSHSVGVKRQDVNPGNLAAGPKLLVCPHSCSRLISNFTNWSCTHLSNVMERIQFGFFFYALVECFSLPK